MPLLWFIQDQLRLMDGKYVELRKVLNETRAKYKVEIQKYVQEAGRLRVRWEKETQGAIPIEYVSLPRTADPNKPRSLAPRSAPSTTTAAAAMAPPLIALVPRSPMSSGDHLDPWSDEKLLSLQQNIQIQKKQQSGRPPSPTVEEMVVSSRTPLMQSSPTSPLPTSPIRPSLDSRQGGVTGGDGSGSSFKRDA